MSMSGLGQVLAKEYPKVDLNPLHESCSRECKGIQIS